jgi:hypothetical protein
MASHVYTSAGVPRLSLSVRQRHARMIMKETEQNYMSFKVGERNVVAFCLKVMIMHSGWLMFGHSVWRNFNSIPPITCRLSWKVNETVKLTKHTRPSLSTWMSWRVFWQCRRRCFFFVSSCSLTCWLKSSEHHRLSVWALSKESWKEKTWNETRPWSILPSFATKLRNDSPVMLSMLRLYHSGRKMINTVTVCL